MYTKKTFEKKNLNITALKCFGRCASIQKGGVLVSKRVCPNHYPSEMGSVGRSTKALGLVTGFTFTSAFLSGSTDEAFSCVLFFLLS